MKRSLTRIFWRSLALSIAVGLIGLFILTPPSVRAVTGINDVVNFQGKVVNSNGTNVTDGVYDFVFKVYDGAGSAATSLFTENWTNAALFSSTMSSAPTSGAETLTYSSNTNEATLVVGQVLWNVTKVESVVITSINTGTNVLGISPTRQAWNTTDTITNRIYVKDGIFRAQINSINHNWGTVNFNDDSIFLGVNFNADGEMKPRVQFGSTPYSQNAGLLDGVDGGSFLRSDSSDNYTSGTLTFDAATTLDINGNLSVADTDIAFDGASTAFTFTGDFVANSDDLVITKATGNVGINTTGPDRKLDVLDASNPQLRLTQADGTVFADMQVDSSGNFTMTTTGSSVTFSGDTVNASDFACTDCLDFGEFADALTLDASTSITLGANSLTTTVSGAGNVIYNLSSSGDFIVQDNSTTFLTLNDSGNTVWTLPAANFLQINAAATDSTTTAGVVDIDVDTSTDTNKGFYIDYQDTNTGATKTFYSIRNDVTIDTNATGNDTVYGYYSAFTQNDTAATAYGVYVTGEDQNYLSGVLGVGTTGPDRKLDVLDASNPQLRLTQADGTVYAEFQVDGSGNLTTTTTGSSVTFSGDTVNASDFACTDCLDFTELEDTLDLDAGLTLNQSTNTWVQNFAGTTTTGLTYNADSLTSGSAVAIASSSTAFTSGGLMNVSWTPGSAATTTGDLFGITLGSNGNVGNLFIVKDGSSTLFSISESAITSNLPHSFTAAGDVSIAYDLQFTNQTSTSIKTKSPLYLDVGDSFESNDLTLRTYNNGDVVFDAAGGLTSVQAQGWDLVNGSTTALNIEGGLLDFDTTNSRVGIATTSPSATLEVAGTGAIVTGTLSTESPTGNISIGNFGGTPRVIFGGSTAWEMDNLSGSFRLYQPGGTPTLFGSSSALGINTTGPDRRLDVLDASNPQLRLTQADGTVYTDFQTGSTGIMTVTTNGSAGSIVLQPRGSGTAALVQIGAGGAGSTTPDFFALDVKSDTGDPAGGAEGYMYYNTLDNKFRCFQGAAWTDCIGAGAIAADTLDFTEFSDAMTVDANTSIALGANALTFNASGAGNLVVNLSSTGDMAFQDNGATFLTLNDSGNTVWSLPAANFLQIDAAATDTTTTAGVIDVDIDTSTDTAKGFYIDFQDTNTAASKTFYSIRNDITIDTNATGNDTVYGYYSAFTQNDTAATANGIYVTGEDQNYFSGVLGVGTTGPDRKLDVLDASNPQLRLTQADGTSYTEFQVDGSGNLAVTASGSIITFNDELVLAGTGRHARRITLDPEYSGAALSTFYGAGTDTNVTGDLTSDADTSGNLLRNYYSWSSSQGALNYYTVAVRVQLPQDFSAWATSNAVDVEYVTQTTSAANNVLDVRIYNGNDTPGTVVASSTGNVSGVAATWTTATIDDSAIVNGGAPEWDAAGESAVIYLRMGSLSSNYTRIGQIRLNYLSKW